MSEVITTKTPDQVGIPNRKNWDSHIACEWVKINFGVKYSPRGMLDVLHRLNLSYTRPTYTLAKANPQKQEEFKKEFELLNYETGHIYCVEEEKYDAEVFLKFLKKVLILYPTGKIVQGFLSSINKVPEIIINRLCLRM